MECWSTGVLCFVRIAPCYRLASSSNGLLDQKMSLYFCVSVSSQNSGTAFQRSIESFLSLVGGRRNNICSAVLRERKEANGNEQN